MKLRKLPRYHPNCPTLYEAEPLRGIDIGANPSNLTQRHSDNNSRKLLRAECSGASSHQSNRRISTITDSLSLETAGTTPHHRVCEYFYRYSNGKFSTQDLTVSNKSNQTGYLNFNLYNCSPSTSSTPSCASWNPFFSNTLNRCQIVGCNAPSDEGNWRLFPAPCYKSSQ